MSILVGPTPTPGTVLNRAWYWLATHNKFRWALMFAAVCTICYIYNTDVAYADNGEISARTLFLPIGDLTDSQGVPVWRYTTLPMDPGNGTYWFRAIRYLLASIMWAIYVTPILLVVALLNWILKFEWLEWLASPFITVSNGISGMLETWMIITLGVLVSCIVIAWGFIRGRMAAAFVEFAMVVIVFGMAASPLANPLTYLVGDGGGVTSSSGMIREASEYGQEAGSLAINPDGEVAEPSLAGSVIDMTMRNPMLTMSFGSPLEGDCAAKWNDEAKNEDQDAEEIRKKVIKCSDEVADANQTDSWVFFIHFIMAIPGAVGTLFLIAVFLGFLVYQVIQVLINAVIATIRAYFALFSGGSRQAWFNSIAQTFVSVILVGLFIFCLSVYLWVLNAVVALIPPGSVQLGSIIIGLIVIFLVITFWRMKKSGKKIGERIAKALGKNGMYPRSEMKPSNFGSTVGNLAKSAANKGFDMYRDQKMARRLAGVAKTGLAATTGGVGAAATTAATSGAKMLAGRAAMTALPPGTGSAAAAAASPSKKRFKTVSREALKNMPGAAANSASTHGATAAKDFANRPAPASAFAMAPSGVREAIENSAQPSVPDMDDYKASRIHEGRYGNTWVHADGTITNPVVISEDGTPVDNIPSEEKMMRAARSGDAWIISPDVSAEDKNSGFGWGNNSNSPAPKRPSGTHLGTLQAAPQTELKSQYRGLSRSLRSSNTAPKEPQREEVQLAPLAAAPVVRKTPMAKQIKPAKVSSAKAPSQVAKAAHQTTMTSRTTGQKKTVLIAPVAARQMPPARQAPAATAKTPKPPAMKAPQTQAKLSKGPVNNHVSSAAERLTKHNETAPKPAPSKFRKPDQGGI